MLTLLESGEYDDKFYSHHDTITTTVSNEQTCLQDFF